MINIDMYTTGSCSYCQLAKQFLQDKGLTFNELRIDEDPQLREAMQARQAGLRSVPQIFIGDTHVGGYEELLEFDKAGKLDALFNQAT